MQLYCAATFYQLLNAIHIKMSFFPQENADIILMDSTNFSKQSRALKQLDVFENIYDGAGAWKNDRDFKNGTSEIRKKMSRDFYNNRNFEFLRKPYSDYFMGGQTPYFKLVYYSLCEHKVYPRVHVFEDGIYTYVLNFVDDCNTDGFLHHDYGKHDIRKNLVNIYAYGDSTMYFGSEEFTYVQIPSLSSDPKVFNKEAVVFKHLWGECPLPKEKYIFLEEGMFQDHLLVADITLLNVIAEVVGKENIIVKRHPRCTYERFKAYGYKVLEHSDFPWELSLLNENAEDHVLISISSTATTTGKTVAGKNIPAIQLYNTRPYGQPGPHATKKKYKDYAKMLSQYMNSSEKTFFTPSSYTELYEILKYVEGVTK